MILRFSHGKFAMNHMHLVMRIKKRLRIDDRSGETHTLFDPNHLISSGSEGIAGSEFDKSLYERIHTKSDIDYFTLHIWPLNWGWVDGSNMKDSLELCIERTNKYIAEHIELGVKHQRPVVIEEFGMPRDGRKYQLDVPTECVIDIWRMCLSKWYLVAVIKECWQVAISGHGEDLEDLIRNIFIGNPEMPIWVIRLKRNKG